MFYILVFHFAFFILPSRISYNNVHNVQARTACQSICKYICKHFSITLHKFESRVILVVMHLMRANAFFTYRLAKQCSLFAPTAKSVSEW